MKGTKTTLHIAAVAAAGCLFGVLSWGGNLQTASTTVSPDRQPAAPAPLLTPEEHERLMKLTRVAITPETATAESVNTSLPPEKSAELASLIEAADQLLGKLARDPSPAAAKAMMTLLDCREPGLRATAVRWMAGRKDTRVAAIARGVQDRSSLVSLVAEQMLVENGATAQAVAAVKSARSAGPDGTERAVRAALRQARKTK